MQLNAIGCAIACRQGAAVCLARMDVCLMRIITVYIQIGVIGTVSLWGRTWCCTRSAQGCASNRPDRLLGGVESVTVLGHAAAE